MSSLMRNLGTRDVVQGATKAITIDRTHHGGPFERGTHHHHVSHGHGGSHGKSNIALTALTLLSFMFFLNMLQNCIQQNMDMQNTQVIVMQPQMQAAREVEAQKRKGEVDSTIANSTLTKIQLESQQLLHKPVQKSSKSEYDEDHHQIPVKFKTVGPIKKQSWT